MPDQLQVDKIVFRYQLPADIFGPSRLQPCRPLEIFFPGRSSSFTPASPG